MDRSVLLDKMENYGIRGMAANIFQSYFDQRYQRVLLGSNHYSDWLINGVGCPQGSILGPLLFIIFVADLPNNINPNKFKTIQYADDTSVFVKKSGSVSLDSEVLECLDKLRNWFSLNGLRMNDNKTELMVFGRSKVDCSNLNIKTTLYNKFLGINLDFNLDFSLHVDVIAKKLNSACFSLKVLSNCVEFDVLKKVYFATFQSHLTYGLITWGSTTTYRFNRIFLIQKRAIRIIHQRQWDEHCKELFINSQIMTLSCLYIFETCKFYIKNKHKFINEIQIKINTRRNFVPFPSHSTAKFEKSSFYMTCKIINKFYRLNIKEGLDKLFLKTVKSYLLQKAYYSLSEFFEEK